MVVGVGVTEEALPDEEGLHAAGEAVCCALDVGGLDGERDEAGRLSARTRDVDSVEHQRVEVDVEVEGRAGTLDGGDCADVGGPVASGAGEAPQGHADGADVLAEDGAGQLGVPGEVAAEGVGEAENPVADRDWWEDAVDQVRGRVRHATPHAAGAEAAALAAEGDQDVVSAVGTGDACEAVGEDAAVEEGSELAGDEGGEAGVGAGELGAVQEGGEVLLEDAVEVGVLGRRRR